MTEQYWQRFMKEYWADPMNTNKQWVGVQKDMNEKHPGKKHPQELCSESFRAKFTVNFIKCWALII